MQSQNFNHVTSCSYLPGPIGPHIKKASLSESSSDIMDLDDGMESSEHPGRHLAPFLRAQQSFEKQQQQLQESNLRAAATNMRYNNAMAVSIETDV